MDVGKLTLHEGVTLPDVVCNRLVVNPLVLYTFNFAFSFMSKLVFPRNFTFKALCSYNF